MNFCSHGPSSKGWAGKDLEEVVLARGLAPLGPIRPSAEGRTWAPPGIPIALLDPTRGTPFLREESLPIDLTAQLLLEIQKLMLP